MGHFSSDRDVLPGPRWRFRQYKERGSSPCRTRGQDGIIPDGKPLVPRTDGSPKLTLICKSETLKYLYLLFSDASDLSLNGNVSCLLCLSIPDMSARFYLEYVFNTEVNCCPRLLERWLTDPFHRHTPSRSSCPRSARDSRELLSRIACVYFL